MTGDFVALSQIFGKFAEYERFKVHLNAMAYADSVEAYKENWTIIKNSFEFAVAYLHRWHEKRHLWAYPWTHRHFNNGSTTSSVAESSNAAYMAWMWSTQGDIVNSIEWTLLQDREQCNSERQSQRRAYLGLNTVPITVHALLPLQDKYSNYVLGKIQAQWSETGFYTLSSGNLCFEVSRESKTRCVIWYEESDIAECSCLMPSSRHYPCRHVLRVAIECKRNIDSQVGRRWLRDKVYIEDAAMGHVATRTEHEENGQSPGTGTCTTSDNCDPDADHDSDGGTLPSPETVQRTVRVMKKDTKNMSPTERHNLLLHESKLLAEVGSRTPGHTHVASIVLASLTKAMSGYDNHDLRTALEALLGELPALVGQPNKKIVTGYTLDFTTCHNVKHRLTSSISYSIIRRRPCPTEKTRCAW